MQGGGAARRRSQSALPRETYYLRSRWSLCGGSLQKSLSPRKTPTCGFADILSAKGNKPRSKTSTQPKNHSGSRVLPAEVFSRKERKVRKEMKGGNEATNGSEITQFAEGEPKRRNYDNKWFCQWMKGGNEATSGSGITQFAEGEPKRRNYDNKRFCQWMEGGNGVREANVVTLFSRLHMDESGARQSPAALCPAQPLRRSRKPYSDRERSSPKKFNHKEHIEHKEKIRREAFIWNRVAVQY